MTLFQLVSIKSPVELTDEGNKKIIQVRDQITNSPSLIQKFLLDSLEGIQIGLSFGKEEGQQFFEKLVDRDLD